MVKTLAEVYTAARYELMKSESEQDATMMARFLVSQSVGIRQTDLFTKQNMTVNAEAIQMIADGISRLQQGEPFAYVLGNWEFYGLPLYVNKDVLIPRDDTCAVTELAINQGLFLGKSPRILDLCCGSGCIGLAVASRLHDARVTLADISADALRVAKKNITLNHLGGRVSCVTLNALEPAPSFLGKFDLIVSNPPYITSAEMEALPASVRDFEPHLALYGGEDGLDFYRSIIANFTQALYPNGYLALEFGMGQGNDICNLLESNGFTIIERKKDYNDRERAVLAKLDRKDV